MSAQTNNIMANDGFEDTKLEDSQLETTANKGELIDNEELLVSRYSKMGAIPLAKLFWRTTLLSFLVLSGALFEGYAVFLPGSIAANKSFIKAFGTVVVNGKVALNTQYVSAWSGMSSGVQLISMIIGSFVSDRYGRRVLLNGVYIFFGVAFVLELTAKNWIYFLFARGFCGFAVGLCKASVPCYIAEIIPTNLRTPVLSLFYLWTVVGQFASAVALNIVQSKSLSWRHAILSELAFFAIYMPIAIFAPESPWFYANKLDHENAKKILRKLNGKVPGYDVDREYAVLAHEVAHTHRLREKQAATAWMEIFKGTNARRTWISFLPLTTTQLAGTMLTSTYLSYFFSLANVSNPFIPTVATNSINILFTIIAALCVDKFGRRILLITCMSIITVCDVLIGVIGTVQKKNGGTLTSSQSIGITAVCCVWVASQAMGPGPLGFVYIADTATPLLRAKTSAFALALSGLFGLLFTYTVPMMISAQEAGWGAQTGYFFAPLALVSTILIYFTVPDTSRRSYAELDELFERKISSRRFPETLTDAQVAVVGVVPEV